MKDSSGSTTPTFTVLASRLKLEVSSHLQGMGFAVVDFQELLDVGTGGRIEKL